MTILKQKTPEEAGLQLVPTPQPLPPPKKICNAAGTSVCYFNHILKVPLRGYNCSFFGIYFTWVSEIHCARLLFP